MLVRLSIVPPGGGEADNCQYVARPQEIEHGLEFCAPLPAGAADFFAANDGTASSFEGGDLDIDVLVEGADAGIAYAYSHRRSPELSTGV